MPEIPNDITGESVALPATYEEAISQVAWLTEKVKVSEGICAELQSALDSLVSENADNLERMSRLEADLSAAGGAEKLSALEAELAAVRRTQAMEHEKRRLHLLEVRELKKTLAERDTKIRELEGAVALRDAQVEKFSADLADREAQIAALSSGAASSAPAIAAEQPALPAGNILDAETFDEAPQIAGVRDELGGAARHQAAARSQPEPPKPPAPKIKYLKKSKSGKYEFSDTPEPEPPPVPPAAPPAETTAPVPPSEPPAAAPEVPAPAVEAVEASSGAAFADELEAAVKNLQKDIFYKEIEIEKLGSALAREQSDALAARSRADELERAAAYLRDEISTKDAQLLRLAESARAAVEENAMLKERYRDLDPIELEKLRIAAEVRDYLEDELDRKYAGEEGDDGEDAKAPRGEPKDQAHGAPEEQKPAQVHELEEIKTKFQKLMKERDDAIALLDKFEIDGKKKEIELKRVREDLKKYKGESETLSDDIKKKEEELQSIYSAFSKYKEESGFMSREYKNIKDDRDRLLGELKARGESVKALEEKVEGLNADLERLREESAAELTKLRLEHETAMTELMAQKDAEVQAVVMGHDAEVARVSEERDAAVGEAGRVAEDAQARFEAARAELYNAGSNLSRLLEFVEARSGSAARKAPGALADSVVFLYDRLPEASPESGHGEASESGGAAGAEERAPVSAAGLMAPFPDVYYSVFNNLKPPPEALTKIMSNLDLTIKHARYIDFVTDIGLHQNYAMIFANIRAREDLTLVYEAAEVAGGTPIVVCCDNPAVKPYEIMNLVVSGAARDYIDLGMPEGAVEAVIMRVLEERLLRLPGVVAEKDADEIKLRESVMLTIDNRVKAGKIETLLRRIDILKENSQKMKFNIKQMQQSFDEIIAMLTNMSMRELPPELAEGFNDVTDLMLRISFIK